MCMADQPAFSSKHVLLLMEALIQLRHLQKWVMLFFVPIPVVLPVTVLSFAQQTVLIGVEKILLT